MTIHARKPGRPSSFHLALDRLDRAFTTLDTWRVPRSLSEADRVTILTIWTNLQAAQRLLERANTAKGMVR